MKRTHKHRRGFLAEFEKPHEILAAARSARQKGYSRLDAFTPFPIEGLSEALDLGKTRLPLVILLCGIAGAAAGYAMQCFAQIVSYPMDIGGRPLHSWPAFVPVTLEMTILGAALGGVIGLCVSCRLPALYHPVFGAAGFSLASGGKFFLCIEGEDPKFDEEKTKAFLESLGPKGVHAFDA